MARSNKGAGNRFMTSQAAGYIPVLHTGQHLAAGVYDTSQGGGAHAVKSQSTSPLLHVQFSHGSLVGTASPLNEHKV